LAARRTDCLVVSTRNFGRLKTMGRVASLNSTHSSKKLRERVRVCRQFGRRPFYRRPKKLSIAITMTTAPTSQIMLFTISLPKNLLLRVNSSEPTNVPAVFCVETNGHHPCRLPSD
jgi:hypothetical protein